MTPDQYCEEKAAASGSSFYYAFRFLTLPRRRAITALYAFCREVDDVVDEISDAGVARAKLAYWRNEVKQAINGTAQHPVLRALAPGMRDYSITGNELETVIDGMQMDLERTRYANWSELETYCHRVAGVVGTMSAKIFGYTQPATLEYAHTLGLAFQMTNIIRDVGEDARRGRIYLPQDELVAHNVSNAQLLRGERSPAFTALMAAQTQRARKLYAQAFAVLPAVDRQAQKPGLIMAAIYERVLSRVETQNFPVLERRVSLAPLTKLWIALRTWQKP